MTRVASSHRRLRRAVPFAPVALVTFVASLIYPLATAGAASAAAAPQSVKLGNFKISYRETWAFKSKDIGICVDFTATGNITYSVSYAINDKFHLRYTWSSQKLNQPTLKASIRAYDRGRCNKTGRATGMDLAQAWTGYSCSYNPSLSFSLPWAISLGFWPSCSYRNQAEYAHYYPGTYSSYQQYNSGDPAGFGNYDSVPAIDTKPTPPCYGVYVYGTAYVRNKSDSYTSSSKRVCLSKY
jgi:hypothetical protein